MARTLGGSGYLLLLLKGEQGEEGCLEDVSRWCGDGEGDVEGETPVEYEFL
jgi:hypothetical protein